MNTLKNYCFTKKEIKELIKYFNFALKQNISIDKDDFIKMIKGE